MVPRIIERTAQLRPFAPSGSGGCPSDVPNKRYPAIPAEPDCAGEGGRTCISYYVVCIKGRREILLKKRKGVKRGGLFAKDILDTWKIPGQVQPEPDCLVG